MSRNSTYSGFVQLSKYLKKNLRLIIIISLLLLVSLFIMYRNKQEKFYLTNSSTLQKIENDISLLETNMKETRDSLLNNIKQFNNVKRHWFWGQQSTGCISEIPWVTLSKSSKKIKQDFYDHVKNPNSDICNKTSFNNLKKAFDHRQNRNKTIECGNILMDISEKYNNFCDRKQQLKNAKQLEDEKKRQVEIKHNLKMKKNEWLGIDDKLIKIKGRRGLDKNSGKNQKIKNMSLSKCEKIMLNKPHITGYTHITNIRHMKQTCVLTTITDIYGNDNKKALFKKRGRSGLYIIPTLGGYDFIKHYGKNNLVFTAFKPEPEQEQAL